MRNGAGKTIALRMLAGLEPLDGGRIEIAGRDVSDDVSTRNGRLNEFIRFLGGSPAAGCAASRT